MRGYPIQLQAERERLPTPNVCSRQLLSSIPKKVLIESLASKINFC